MARRSKQKWDILYSYYEKGQISKEIKSITLDKERFEKQIVRTDINEYKDDIYNRFKIKKFESKDAFIDYQASVYPDLKTSEVNKRWNDYLHRDELITSGQYEEYRYKQYRENYIEALTKGGFPNELIRNVQNLPFDKWKEIIILPGTKKDNISDRQFPVLGGFKYGDANKEFINRTIEEIRDAFGTLGVPYIDKLDLKKKRKEIIKAKSLTIDEGIEFDIKNTIRVMDKIGRQGLGNVFAGTVDEVVELGQRLQKKTKTTGTSLVKTSKSGNRYIPFVGTTRQGSRNEKFMKALLAGYDDE